MKIILRVSKDVLLQAHVIQHGLDHLEKPSKLSYSDSALNIQGANSGHTPNIRRFWDLQRSQVRLKSLIQGSR